jgi:hypothetical protein
MGCHLSYQLLPLKCSVKLVNDEHSINDCVLCTHVRHGTSRNAFGAVRFCVASSMIGSLRALVGLLLVIHHVLYLRSSLQHPTNFINWILCLVFN